MENISILAKDTLCSLKNLCKSLDSVKCHDNANMSVFALSMGKFQLELIFLASFYHNVTLCYELLNTIKCP